MQTVNKKVRRVITRREAMRRKGSMRRKGLKTQKEGKTLTTLTWRRCFRSKMLGPTQGRGAKLDKHFTLARAASLYPSPPAPFALPLS